MQYLFYDTCALLEEQRKAFEGDKFYISNITLREIEGIKTSKSKDEDVKMKARKLVHLLDERQDKYEVINFELIFEDIYMTTYSSLDDTADSRIIMTALSLRDKNIDILFYTRDLACKSIASSCGLKVKYLNDIVDDDYTGYVEVKFTDEELCDFYNGLRKPGFNPFNMYVNQYLLIRLVNGVETILYKMGVHGLEEVMGTQFSSSMFETKTKPKDEYQDLVMDSLRTNQITLIRGKAGSGKSYLAMAALFDKLQHREIEKIIIFTNTVAVEGAARLGFYPGSKDEKLLDSQIGNFLVSKIGDRGTVIDLIEAGTIVLLPLADIRGFDTTGLKAGIYITEAQNMNIDLMKLALQRIGEDSYCIIEGDDFAQVDLAIYGGNNNGMRRLSQVFRGQDFYGEVRLVYIHRSKIARIAELM